jgi:hypothetical protein
MMDDGVSPYLFLEVPLRGPVEELRDVFERKARMHVKLGELDAAERWRHAYEIARAKLEAVLSAPLPDSVACSVAMQEPSPVESAQIVVVEPAAAAPLLEGSPRIAESPCPRSAEPSSPDPLDGSGEV